MLAQLLGAIFGALIEVFIFHRPLSHTLVAMIAAGLG